MWLLPQDVSLPTKNLIIKDTNLFLEVAFKIHLAQKSERHMPSRSK